MHISSKTKQLAIHVKCSKILKQLQVSNTMIVLVKLQRLCTMLKDMMETMYPVDYAWQIGKELADHLKQITGKIEKDILCEKLTKRPSIKNYKIKENREIPYDEVGRATIRRPSPFPGGEAARAKYASPANRSSHFLVP